MTINKEKLNSYKNLRGITMANHVSAKKRIRRNARMEIINKIRKNRVRSFIKKVELAIEKADKSEAQKVLKDIQEFFNKKYSLKNRIANKFKILFLLYLIYY